MGGIVTVSPGDRGILDRKPADPARRHAHVALAALLPARIVGSLLSTSLLLLLSRAGTAACQPRPAESPTPTRVSAPTPSLHAPTSAPDPAPPTWTSLNDTRYDTEIAPDGTVWSSISNGISRYTPPPRGSRRDEHRSGLCEGVNR
jgi:hypothetical protein